MVEYNLSELAVSNEIKNIYIVRYTSDLYSRYVNRLY